jgi:hypothetical protein
VSGFSISGKLPAVGAILAAIGAIAAAPTENNASRATGAYAYIPAQDAASCAIACAQDNICLAWSFKATELVGCALKAIVPPADSGDALGESGIAPRAEQFLSLTTLRRPEAPPPDPSPPPMGGSVSTAEPLITASAMLAPLLVPPGRYSLSFAAPQTFIGISTTDLATADAPIEAATLLRATPLAAPARPTPLRLALSAPPAWPLPAVAETQEITSFSWVNATLAPEVPEASLPTLSPIAKVSLALAAPLAEPFSPPETYLHVALAPAPHARPASAPPPLASLALAVAAPLAEEFVATAPDMRIALLTLPAPPRAAPAPTLQAIAWRHPAVADPEADHFAQTAAAEAGAALSQMRLALQPVMIVASATTPTARRYQPTAEPAPEPASSSEEDLLGGPDAQ